MTEMTETAPGRLPDLTQGEHLLLWGFRATACGKGDCRIVRRTYDMSCGFAGLEALAAIAVFLRELKRRGRREVTLAVPGAFELTRDEQLILAVFAAAQAEDYARMEAHLVWLLGQSVQPPFGAAACLVAQAMAMNGLVLRLPPMAVAPRSGARLDVRHGGEQPALGPARIVDHAGVGVEDHRRAPL